jgi:hypothetical protein
MADQGQGSTGTNYAQGHMESAAIGSDQQSGPLVEGISNEDIWRLTRRFNKVFLAEKS